MELGQNPTRKRRIANCWQTKRRKLPWRKVQVALSARQCGGGLPTASSSHGGRTWGSFPRSAAMEEVFDLHNEPYDSDRHMSAATPARPTACHFLACTVRAVQPAAVLSSIPRLLHSCHAMTCHFTMSLSSGAVSPFLPSLLDAPNANGVVRHTIPQRRLWSVVPAY